MILLKNIIILSSFILLFTACGGGNSTSSTQTEKSKKTTAATQIDSQVIKKASMSINNLTVGIHKNTFDVTNKMYTHLNNMLHSYTNVNKVVTDTMDEQMKLLKLLAQPFKIADGFKDRFDVTDNYTATTPAFVIKKQLTSKYFLVSSNTKFFIEGKTIKTYFNDSTTLTNGWKRVIKNADKSKDLYLTLVEIDNSNIMNQVATVFTIKKDKLNSL